MAIGELGVMVMFWILGIIVSIFKFSSKDRSKASKQISKILGNK